MAPLVKLSEAEIWTRLREFYELANRQAFQPGGIPFQITSNPAMSHAYARMVASWIRDWSLAPNASGRLDPDHPVYILELGPGTGQFTFLFTQDLRTSLDRAGLGTLRTCHVCADVSPNLLNEIGGHHRLAPFAAQGLVDFALFDAIDPQPLILQRRQKRLEPADMVNPLIVIANYFFDSLPQDCFWMGGGQLFESLTSLSSAAGPTTAIAFEHRAAATPYYGDEELDRILETSAAAQQGAILLPVAGLKLLKWLWQLAGGRMLLLAADKGYVSASELAYPAIETHAEHCISMMVNFAAIEKFWTGRGGRFRCAHRENAFLTFAAAEVGLGSHEATALAQTFAECCEDYTPEDWDTLSWRAVRDVHLYSAAEILAHMRLSRWDADILSDSFPALFRLLPTMPEAERLQVKEAVCNTLDRYYHLGAIPDLFFKGGSVLYGLGFYGEALIQFGKSRDVNGPLPATRLQTGRCLYRLGRKVEALSEIRAALAAEPNFEDYLIGMGIVTGRHAAELAGRIEWEIGLPDSSPDDATSPPRAG